MANPEGNVRFVVVLSVSSTGIRQGYKVEPTSPTPCATVYQVSGNPEDLFDRGTWEKICGPATVERIDTPATPPARFTGDLFKVTR